MAKILITDDAAFMRMMLKDIISKRGHEIYEAGNGVECLEKFVTVNPDLVTLDITMPEMDGLHALEKLKQIDPKCKVIMCSAMGQQAMVMEAIKIGANDFIVKPFQHDRVLTAIDKVLNR